MTEYSGPQGEGRGIAIEKAYCLVPASLTSLAGSTTKRTSPAEQGLEPRRFGIGDSLSGTLIYKGGEAAPALAISENTQDPTVLSDKLVTLCLRNAIHNYATLGLKKI